MEDNRAETADLCDKISHEVMRPMLTQSEFVYIDVELIFDFMLTALLSKMPNEEKCYNYVIDHVKDYLAAPTLECAKFFPDLNLTDDQLRGVLRDPKYSAVLSAMILPTGFQQELGTIIRVLNTVNKSKETQRPLRFTINSSLMKLTPRLEKMVLSLLFSLDPSVEVKFTNFKDWSEVPEKLLVNQDLVCVYDIKDFMKEGSTFQKVLSKSNDLSKTNILALENFDHDSTEAIFNFKAVMSMFCNDFNFFRKSLIVKEDKS